MDKFMNDKVYCKIIEFCQEPKTSRQVKDHIGIGISSTNHRIGNLIDAGYMKVIKPFNLNNRGWKYQAVDKVKLDGRFRPQGMCVLGVWI